MIETMERIQMKCHKVSIVIGGGSDVTMVSGWELGSLLLVSVLWGVTNPFLRKGAEGLEVVKEKRTLRQLLSETRFLICNYRELYLGCFSPYWGSHYVWQVLLMTEISEDSSKKGTGFAVSKCKRQYEM
ncbi:transmembrane protein 234 isoform 2-T2 [Discoglossus pictus]